MADLQRMDRLTSFPEEFGTLGPRLRTILAKVFAPTAYNENHFFRGVYFTSGVQEGQPVLSACRALVGDRADRLQEEDIAEIAGDSKAYFIADLYEEKIFREAGLVRLTQRATREQRRRRIAYVSVSAVIALAITAWVGSAAVQLWNLAQDPYEALVTAIGEEGGVEALTDTTADDLLPSMTTLSAEVEKLEQSAEASSALIGPRVSEAAGNARLAYRKLFGEKVFGPLLEDFLDCAEAAMPSSPEEEAELAKALLALHKMGVIAAGEGDLLAEDAPPLSLELFLELLREMKAPHDRAREASKRSPIRYDKVRQLAKALGSTDGDELLVPVVDRTARPATIEQVQRLLRTQIVGYWERLATTLKTPDPGDQRPEATYLKDAWYWSRISALDRALQAELSGLGSALEQMAKVRSLSEFNRHLATWRTGQDRVQELRSTLESFFSSAEASFPSVVAAWKRGFEERKEDLLGVAEKQTGESRALHDAVNAFAGLLADLSGSGAAPWNQLAVDASQWKSGPTWDEFGQWHKLIVYVDTTPASLLDPGRDFGRFGEVNDPTRLLLEGFTPSPPTGREGPRALQELLGAARKHQTCLENRIVTMFFRDLALELSEGGRRAAFLQGLASLDTKNYLYTAADKHYTGRTAKRFAGVLVRLLDLRENYADGKQHVLWSDADPVVRAMQETAEDYFVDGFLDYWKRGITADFTQEDLTMLRVALERELVDTKAFRGWFARFDKESFKRVKDIADFTGDQEDEPETGTLGSKFDGQVKTCGPEFETVYRLWRHYAQDRNRKSLKVVADDMADAFDQLAKAGTDDGLLDKARQAREIWLKPDALRKDADLPLDPVLDVLVRRAWTAREALEARPLALYSEKWVALIERARECDLVVDTGRGRGAGRFPFIDVDKKRPDDFHPADWDKTMRFLDAPELGYLRKVQETEAKSDLPTNKVAFVQGCWALRELLRSKKVKLTVLYGGGNNDSTGWNYWRLSLSQQAKQDDKPLVTPFYAPWPELEWTPGEPASILVAPRETATASVDSVDREHPWQQERLLRGVHKETPHWSSVLAFCFAPRAEVRVPQTEGEKPVRWIRLSFERAGVPDGKPTSMVLGIVTDPPLPEALPDLETALVED